jgi:hypothetical protein
LIVRFVNLISMVRSMCSPRAYFSDKPVIIDL